MCSYNLSQIIQNIYYKQKEKEKESTAKHLLFKLRWLFLLQAKADFKDT
jgi:hypothetical protein